MGGAENKTTSNGKYPPGTKVKIGGANYTVDENGDLGLPYDDNGNLIYNGGTPMPVMFPEYGALLASKLFNRKPVAQYNTNQISGANSLVPTW